MTYLCFVRSDRRRKFSVDQINAINEMKKMVEPEYSKTGKNNAIFGFPSDFVDFKLNEVLKFLKEKNVKGLMFFTTERQLKLTDTEWNKARKQIKMVAKGMITRLDLD